MDMEKREAAVIQNLKDAGCDKDTITSFMEYYEAREVRQELKVLSEHRTDLLDALHVCQKQIDCLDYLAWQIGKEEGRK